MTFTRCLQQDVTLCNDVVFQTGSVSSLASLDELSEVDRLRRRLEDAENEKKALNNKVIQEYNCTV